MFLGTATSPENSDFQGEIDEGQNAVLWVYQAVSRALVSRPGDGCFRLPNLGNISGSNALLNRPARYEIYPPRLQDISWRDVWAWLIPWPQRYCLSRSIGSYAATGAAQ